MTNGDVELYNSVELSCTHRFIYNDIEENKRKEGDQVTSIAGNASKLIISGHFYGTLRVH